MNYEKLGLMCGLEIHQQLDTGKLFCSCSFSMQEKNPDAIVKRKLHAVAGELGEIDPAAMAAVQRGASYVYHFYNDVNCLVDLDEEPPHPVNKEALQTAYLFAKMLNADVVDEINIMRKTVLDGSNTSGFQRTALIATGGRLDYGKDSIGIQTICLEEDAARIIKTQGNEIVYNLDRLGTPLIEVATTPHIHTPEQAREVALALGLLLRATKKVRRGIGTIRQDLNVSIKDGARCEIKGAQELNLIPKIVEYEVTRQVALLALKDELFIRNAPRPMKDYHDLSNILRSSVSNVIQKTLKSGKTVLAAKLPQLEGLLKKEVSPNRRFGTELADYGRSMGASGLFHSDELPNYGITLEEVSAIKKALGCAERDAFVLIAESKEIAEKALDAIIDRVNLAFEKIPGETRKANADGTSSYLRPIPGGARMYPETDLLTIDSKLAVSSSQLAVPAAPWELIAHLETKYKLSHELASEIYNSEKLEVFEKIAKSVSIEPTLIATTLTNTINSLNLEIEFSAEHFIHIFNALKAGKFAKEVMPQVLDSWAKNPSKALEQIIFGLGFEKISNAELEKLIQNIVAKNKILIVERGAENAIKPLMGDVMKEVRGRADGKLIMEVLRREIGKI